MTEPIAEAAARRQRDRDRAEVERDEGRDRGRAHPELLHHAGQRDGEHRGVEGHEDRPGRQSEHRAGHQAGLAARRCRLLGALGHNSRTKPVVPSSSSMLTVGDPGRGIAGADDRRQIELARHDRRVGEDAARVRHETAGDREERHPGRVRRGRDDDVARLHAGEVLRAEHDPCRPTDDAGRGASPAHDRLVLLREALAAEPTGRFLVGRLPDLRRWRDAAPVVVLVLARGHHRSPVRGLAEEVGHLGAAKEEHVARPLDDALRREASTDPHHERA